METGAIEAHAVEEQPLELARVLSEVARDLEAEPDEQQTLAGIVLAAVATVPGAAYGGITQVHRRRITAQAPSDPVVSKVDELQAELREGPCLDAFREQQTVIINDMATETRWPAFATRAADLGLGSLISFRLYVRDESFGALNLYGLPGTRFDEAARVLGEVFATHAAIALSEVRTTGQLSQAVESRGLIGQAKGLLMCRNGISAERAWEMLVDVSQRTNLKLTEVARWIVNEHENPGADNRPRGS